MEIKYKKEVRPKISHFWSPKESSYGWERRREKGRGEKKKKKKRPRKVRKSSFCMELVWFWVWKLKFLYGLYGLLWVSVNLWTFI